MDSPEAPFLQKLREIFRVEAADHVHGISSGLLALEKAPAADRATLIEQVFREAHSLKGAARAVDYGEIERLSQAMEDELARWRETCITTFLVGGPVGALPMFAELILG